jgi:Tfp pilus assembly protein PilF
VSRANNFLFCFLIVAAGCSSSAVRETGLDRLAPRQAEQSLSAGIKDYEDGDYKNAAAKLHRALEQGLLFDRDKLSAHKYLAFVHCSAGRQKSCRDEFRAALAIDPKFELSAVETGHPSWGPVYRSVKAEAATRK